MADSKELSDKQLKQIKTLFKEFDKDGSGSISNNEVQSMLAKIGLKLDIGVVNKLVKSVDFDNSGEIDVDEFITLVKRALFGGPPPPAPTEREFPAGDEKSPIFVYIGGQNPAKYLEYTVQSLRFLKRRIPTANVGLITPPDSGDDLVEKVTEELQKIDTNLDTSNIKSIEGKKHLDDWGNTQYILDIDSFAQDYDPIVVLDVDTIVLEDLLPALDTFKQTDKKFGLFKDYVKDYPNFAEKWEGPEFVPQRSFMVFRSSVVPDILPIWEESWKEWIEPAPFVGHKDPARFIRSPNLYAAAYALGQALQKYVQSFDDEVHEYKRGDLKLAHNLSIDAQKVKHKYLLAGSSYSNDGESKITITVESAKINEKDEDEINLGNFATGLKDMIGAEGEVHIGKGDHVVSVTVGEYEKETKVIRDSLEPVWDQDLVFTETTYADANKVLFKLTDSDTKTEIGTAELSLLADKTHTTSERPTQHYTLSIVDSEQVEKAKLEVNAEFYVEELPEDDDEPKTRDFAAPEALNTVIRAVSAKIYNSHDVIGKDDPFLKITVGGVEKQTKVIKGTQDPVWNEDIKWDNLADAALKNITLTLWDYDSITKSDLIGTGKIASIESYRGKKGHITVPVLDKKNKEQGKVELDVVVNGGAPVAATPVSSPAKTREFAAVQAVAEEANLKSGWIKAISAKIPKSHDVIGKDDPFLKIVVGKVEKQTKVVNGTQNPTWNEEFTFDNITDAAADSIVITLWDYDSITKNDLIGTGQLSLKNYTKKGHVTVPVFDKKKKEQGKVELDVQLLVETKSQQQKRLGKK